jgi:hypothetical protein
MLYLREEETGDKINLIRFCRRCGYKEPTTDDESEGVVVYEKNYETGYIRPRIDAVAFGDPAVPTTKEIVCSNKECISRTSEDVEPSAKYIVLDSDMYSILYRCNHCECVWKNKN